MKNKNLLALLTLTVFGCGNEDLSTQGLLLQQPSASPGVASEEAQGNQGNGLSGEAQNGAGDNQRKPDSGSSGSDYFNCFASGACSAPTLSSSTSCITGRDYSTSVTDRSSDVVVLSFHGGQIEPKSTEVASDVATTFHWSHYNFSAHASSTCLSGMSNYGRLHITATNFDDPVAVRLVVGHKKAVAIHGYSNSRGNSRGTICVGGANSAQVAEFISYVTQNQASFGGYTLQPVNAASGNHASGADCSGLTGTASKNLVNRVSGGRGGLQLEMNDAIKVDLLNSATQYDGLRSVVYGAVSAAMSK